MGFAAAMLLTHRLRGREAVAEVACEPLDDARDGALLDAGFGHSKSQSLSPGLTSIRPSAPSRY